MPRWRIWRTIGDVDSERVQPDSPSGLVTITAAADRLSASRRSVYRLNERGVLDFVYLSPDMPRVRERDLVALVENGAWPGHCATEINEIVKAATRPIRRGRS
jgi:hypothetical protein